MRKKAKTPQTPEGNGAPRLDRRQFERLELPGLIEVARRQPKSRDELGKIRGVGASSGGRRAQELLEQLWLDGDIGEKIRKAAKAKFPDAKILDDTVAPFVAPLKAENAALKERLDKMEADRAAEREAAEKHSAQTNLESALARARQDYNLTDEGFDKMVARMKETGNYADADAAAIRALARPSPNGETARTMAA